MKCNFCGNDVENGRETCAYCGSSVVDAKSQPTLVYPGDNQNAGNQTNQYYSNQNANNARPVVNSTPLLIWAIVNTVCCCTPLGIAGIVFAAKAGNAATQDLADQSLKTAKTLNIVGTSVGAVGVILYLVFVGGSAFLSF